ncbi:hypothetical protein A3F28_01025 [Candidatus Uhrbacteria bacterium RIFCSPHIGHO2_12_FULL_57_11]|uniref:SHS2 domain-containing protein n=2 Tax=Candidatus Uhriibacteriota TaxID=1752732 RepID=A0A1F7UI50_9BACT|nr:MAG: hypothetical protein A3D72_00105 [Candidatus Uhrbacteria bacterium RIFCSPHIGHO2_02_FULL_57_19]OGL77932.1 MAG: hypothetical protein A3F28_01025 [Candidatus Uhrbacteria bacterium RIFCSPHIGHO2_12_FULL_57_11]
MALFGKQSAKSYLGVDIGSGGFKLVELQNDKGRAKLVTYAFTERGPEEMAANPLDTPEVTADLVKSMVARSKARSRRAVSALPVAGVFSSILSVPAAAGKELKAAIEIQAKKLIPIPLEEMILDWKVLGEVSSAPKGPAPAGNPAGKWTQVLLTGAPKKLVQKYIDVAKRAGLELISLETEAFALIRSLVGRDRATTMIVDIGAVRTNIILVENGIPYLSRSIDLGGLSFTKAIGNALGASLSAAEQMKADVGALSAILPERGVPKVLEPLMANLGNEMRYLVNLFSSQRPGAASVEKVVVTGGSALLPRVTDYLQEVLGVKAYLGDPWARVIYPTELRPQLEIIGPRFAVAVGLAMRDIE